MRLAGKTALITGAARGLGLEFARAYIAEGATVALADVDGDRVRNAAAALGPGAVAIRKDVTRQDEIDAGFAEASGALGQLDILSNTAALVKAAQVAQMTRAGYGRDLAAKARGTFIFLPRAGT